MRKSDKALSAFTHFLRHEELLMRNCKVHDFFNVHVLQIRKLDIKRMEKEKENLDPDIEEMDALVTRVGKYTEKHQLALHQVRPKVKVL